MPSLHNLVYARDDATAASTATATATPSASPDQQKTLDYAIVVLGLVFFGLLLATSLLLLRRFKRAQTHEFLAARDEARGRARQRLPSYCESDAGEAGLTIQTTTAGGRSSILVLGRDGRPMLADPAAPPHAPANVPQIHITFPDEHDARTGRRTEGRVVVVRLGDNASAVGLEPVAHHEQLPAYEKEAKVAAGQFYSIDMNHIGGLKEKSDHYQ